MWPMRVRDCWRTMTWGDSWMQAAVRVSLPRISCDVVPSMRLWLSTEMLMS